MKGKFLELNIAISRKKVYSVKNCPSQFRKKIGKQKYTKILTTNSVDNCVLQISVGLQILRVTKFWKKRKEKRDFH